MIFKNRHEAGILLAQKLISFTSPNTLILGLARGGLVVATVISQELSVPVDVLVVKKLTSHSDPELAIGACAPDGVMYIDWRFAHQLGIDEDTVNKVLAPDVFKLIEERTILYHRGRKPAIIKNKTVILVDDGAATGATMRAAIVWAKRKKAKKIVIALPVSPPEFILNIKSLVDELIILDTPGGFHSVGQFYDEFPQVGDEEVVQLLANSHESSTFSHAM